MLPIKDRNVSTYFCDVASAYVYALDCCVRLQHSSLRATGWKQKARGKEQRQGRHRKENEKLAPVKNDIFKYALPLHVPLTASSLCVV